jgi:Rrf2 family protein
MSVLFSKQCEYALRAVLYLALRPAGALVPIRELTLALKIPYHFLGKILQDLAQQGLLRSHKGPAGGFGLRRPAGEITLLEIVEAVDGDALLRRCVLGFPECSGKHPCAMHTRWEGLRREIHLMLGARNIVELAEGTGKQAYARARAAPQAAAGALRRTR